MFASANGHIEIAKLLLAHGADVNQTNIISFTALMLASHYRHTEIINLLRKHGAV